MRFQRLVLPAAAALIAVAAFLVFRPGAEIRVEATPAGADASGRTLYWFKGNTHAHSRIAYQGYTHGDSQPAEVVRWYHDHGYHFIALTDHNRYTGAGSVRLPRNARGNFLVIPGMEITSDHRYPGVAQEGERKIHATALNTGRNTDWTFTDARPAAILGAQVRRVGAAAGLHILNHPNYRFQIRLDDLLQAEGLTHFELANAHPRAENQGHAGFRPAVEDLWDQALSAGKLLYGVATDDAHDFKWHRRGLRFLGMAPPGGAWIMVAAPRLSAADVTRAIREGNFYASTGVFLGRVRVGNGRYAVDLDTDRTRQDVRHAWVRDTAPLVRSDDSHFVIEFIGSHGRVLHSVHNQESASVALDPAHGYVRARVTYLERIPDWLDRDRARAYYAWTQPVMTATGASAEQFEVAPQAADVGR